MVVVFGMKADRQVGGWITFYTRILLEDLRFEMTQRI